MGLRQVVTNSLARSENFSYPLVNVYTKPWKDHHDPPFLMGKWWENHGKMVIYMERSPWSTILYGKMMGKPWENGDLYGQIHHFEWEDSLFRLGHVQSQTVSLPEGTGKFRWQIHTVITGKIWQTSGLRFNKLGALKEASSASDSPPLGICSSFSKINSLGDVNRAAARETGWNWLKLPWIVPGLKISFSQQTGKVTVTV